MGNLEVFGAPGNVKQVCTNLTCQQQGAKVVTVVTQTCHLNTCILKARMNVESLATLESGELGNDNK